MKLVHIKGGELIAAWTVSIITIMMVVGYMFFDVRDPFIAAAIGAGLGYFGAKIERNTKKQIVANRVNVNA